MRKKSFKKLGAALMAAVLMMSSFGNMSAVQAEESVTQMSSEKEIVYVNSYGDSKREQNFDSNWKFYLGDASGADTVGFDDSNWRTVNLPHDYSIEQDYTTAGEAESGYLLGGTGWYRKHFSLDKTLEGKEIRIDFGGVYMNATVWVNGTKLGTHPYGYTPFSFDITDYVTFDGENVITVKVDHQTPSSRWYSGSGIYRSVNLTVMDKVHVDLYGTEITTPNLEAEINAETGEEISKPENKVERISGGGRIDTSLAIADTLKGIFNVDKFDNVVIATSGGYADALPGSYLAYVKKAPILLVSEKRMDEIVAYVKANLADNGKVYILGGTQAVSASMESKLAGYDVERLQVEGKGRYFTNLAILNAAGVKGGEMIVATGLNYADSLSASASKLPILMVRGTELSDAQKAFLASAEIEKFYIVGGPTAVDPEIDKALENYATAKTDGVVRVAGGNRRETSVMIAETFCQNPDQAVVATASDYPDGLCGGPLAAALNAPLVLTVNDKTTEAAEYAEKGNIKNGYVLGGTTAMTEKTVEEVFGPLNLDGSEDTETNSGKTVNMAVKTTVVNESTAAKNITLVHNVYEKGTENSIGTVTTEEVEVAAGAKVDIEATLPAKNPKLWGLGEENAHLYTVVTEVKVGEDIIDTYETEYGFRYFKFETDTGFYLNGEPVKLKGVCMHHDQGALGAEAHYRATERQVEILQEMGCNSIRVTHNPASDALIAVANEKGILLIEELFDGLMYAKNGNRNDYSNWFAAAVESGNQILGAEAEPMAATDNFLGRVNGLSWAQFDMTATIKRGFNSPAIFMWSLGNEIWEGAGGHAQFPPVVDTLIAWATELDASRPSTTGDNNLKGGKTNSPWSYQIAESLTAAGGAVGANYCSGGNYDSIYNMYKNVEGFALYGSETASHINSRGVYYKTSGDSNKELTAYDYSAVGWGAVASAAWYDVVYRDYVAGEYVWTGFDYIGEPTTWNGTGPGAVGTWPSPKNSFFGIIDTAGLPKDNFYFYQSQWNDEVTTLHVLPAWNRDVVVSGNVPIVVYSDAAAVELFFTNAAGQRTSLGKKAFTEYTTAAGYTYQMYEGSDKSYTTHQNMYLTWYKAFEEGTIEAVAYDKAGNVIADTVGRNFVTTTGNEAKLDATVDRATIDADGKDLAYIRVDVTDAEGNIVPDASNKVTFKVDGPGVLVGVDNGKQADHQSFQDDNRAAYNGSLIAIVQSTKEAGEITVTASASGLTSDSVTINTESTGEAAEVGFFMSKNYYVQVGKKPVLPATIETRMPDGTSDELEVVWNEISADDYAKAGTFSVGGTVDGKYSVAVTVNMIDEIGGLLNYSTTTPVGTAVILPETRPAVLPNGTILDVFFPVTWEAVEADAYDEVGTFVVDGVANVFGDEYAVTATIRVQKEIVSIVGSVDNPLTLTEDIEDAKTSDTLAAVWDGSTTIGDNSEGGRNTTAWSNYNNSQEGDNTAEITFEYATQQRIGEVVIHFWKDGYAAEHPDAGTTEIYISDTGAEDSWTKVDATETIGTETDRVKPYTYKFDAVTATFVKFCLTNSTATKTAKTCTGITEIEIKKAAGTFTTNTTAALDSATVAGTALTAKELASGVYYTLDKTPVVEVAGKDNAAVTVLPVYEGKILVIIESEDHKVRETFTIFVGQEKPEDPADASRDVAVEDITYKAGSAQSQSGDEGPIAFAFDGKENTFWHSEWNPTWYGKEDCSKYLYVEMVMKEVTLVDAVRCLPRGGNGDITSYRVEGSVDGTTWETLTEGTWPAGDTGWKLAKFEAKELIAVRLVATGTTSDTVPNKFAAAREIRVRTAKSVQTPETPETPVIPEVVDPTDASRDIPLTALKVSVANYEDPGNANEGPAGFAVDNNPNTWWHTEWDGLADRAQHWIQFEVADGYKVDGLRYLPRNNAGGQDAFGTITKYQVLVSNDGTTWTAVADGKWDNNNSWKLASFEGQSVKYVRLMSVESVSDHRTFTSAAEVRLTGVNK